MSNISMSNQVYSTTLGGANPLKSLFVTEGENLVSFFLINSIFNINNRLVVQDYVKNYGTKCVELTLEKKVY